MTQLGWLPPLSAADIEAGTEPKLGLDAPLAGTSLDPNEKVRSPAPGGADV